MSTEALLVVLIFAFYLKDSLLMLRTEEAVLVCSARGVWRAGFGARTWRWAGREPYLANPLLPHEPVVRLRWSMRDARAGSPVRRVVIAPELRRLGIAAWVTWIILFLVFPWALLGRDPHVSLLVTAGFLYASVAASLMGVWCVRDSAGISVGGFAVLAFECLACPPYAANIVRRVVWHQPFDEDFFDASARVLDPDGIASVRRECLARVDEALEAEEDANGLARLNSSRLRFVSEEVDEQ